MGTRSLTYIYDEKFSSASVQPLACLYRQYDGYPSGHGAELAEFLNSKMVVDGYNDEGLLQANGMGCLAAQLVSHFKTGCGNFYLRAPVLGLMCWQEYEYHVFEGTVKVIECGKDSVIFDGTWKELLEFCSTKEEA